MDGQRRLDVDLAQHDLLAVQADQLFARIGGGVTGGNPHAQLVGVVTLCALELTAASS